MRKSVINRKTNETDISLELNLDGTGNYSIDTGVGFFDHCLELMCFHGKLDLNLKVKGDLHIDDHHTVEDIGLALGQAFKEALGDKKGIKRYSSIYLPMDEALSRIVLDISNRPFLVYNCKLYREKIGTLDTQNVKEFFKSFVTEARITLHLENLYGENDHHIVESIFKGVGRVLKEASEVTSNTVSSSKGVL